MASKSFCGLSDTKLLEVYATRAARLASVQGVALPVHFVRELEWATNQALRECQRRGFSQKQLKDTVDQATVDAQTKSSLERQYQVKVSAMEILFYAGKESKHELRCRLARTLIDDLIIACSDPKLMESMLNFEEI